MEFIHSKHGFEIRRVRNSLPGKSRIGLDGIVCQTKEPAESVSFIFEYMAGSDPGSAYDSRDMAGSDPTFVP